MEKPSPPNAQQFFFISIIQYECVTREIGTFHSPIVRTQGGINRPFLFAR